MKILNKIVFVLSSLILFTLIQSCQKDNCPDGFTGDDCEHFDINQIQALLDAGQTPIALYNADIPIDSLYGKYYQGGLIFYLDTINGNGMVAASNNFEDEYIWGMNNGDSSAPDVWDINNNQETELGARIGDGLANTEAIITSENEANLGSITAAEACYLSEENGFTDWFLPSRGELRFIYQNLDANGFGNFFLYPDSNIYWSSTENGTSGAWVVLFGYGNGTQSFSQKEIIHHTRAVRAF